VTQRRLTAGPGILRVTALLVGGELHETPPALRGAHCDSAIVTCDYATVVEPVALAVTGD